MTVYTKHMWEVRSTYTRVRGIVRHTYPGVIHVTAITRYTLRTHTQHVRLHLSGYVILHVGLRIPK